MVDLLQLGGGHVLEEGRLDVHLCLSDVGKVDHSVDDGDVIFQLSIV